MSCRFCARWKRADGYDWESDDNVGDCTLNPVWVKTGDKHFCSQFLQETGHFESTLLFENNKAMHKARQSELDERARRVELQKKVKGLRAQIMALKSERAGNEEL